MHNQNVKNKTTMHRPTITVSSCFSGYILKGEQDNNIVHRGISSLNQKGLTAGVVLLVLGAGVIPLTAYEGATPYHLASQGDWLYVGGSGPGNFSEIQQAIDNASDGDTVFVFSGTYVGHLNINKSITLLGEDKNTTFILGYVAFTISFISDWVTMGRFTIQNSGRLGEGIRIDSSHNMFFDTIIEFPYDNIRIAGDHNTIAANIISCDTIYLGGQGNIITGNSITNAVHGIYLTDAEDNIITRNTFLSCGLFLSDDSPCNTLVTNNTVNGKPLIYLSNTSDRIVSSDAGQIILVECINITVHNHALFNTTVGIQVLRSSACVVSGNIIGDSLYGVWLNGWYNTLYGNTIRDNEYGILLKDSVGNRLYHNNLLHNTLNAFDSLSNTWDDPLRHEGNYWSDYTGGDTDGDGIGDTPYDIPGGDNQDHYPFMEPNGWIHPPYPPSIHGPHCGKRNTVYIFSIDTVTCPEEDHLYCMWDWGDGTQSDWLGPYDSGDVVETSHTWSNQGSYMITVKLKNSTGAEGNWSEPFPIDITSKVLLGGIIQSVVNQSGICSIFEMSRVVIISGNPFAMERYFSMQVLIVFDEFRGMMAPRFIAGVMYAMILNKEQGVLL